MPPRSVACLSVSNSAAHSQKGKHDGLMGVGRTQGRGQCSLGKGRWDFREERHHPKASRLGGREMALPENSGSIPSTHVVHSHLYLLFQCTPCPLLVLHRHPGKRRTDIHEGQTPLYT